MEPENPEQKPAEAKTPAPQQGPPEPKPQPSELGDAGKRALQAERDARKALEAEVSTMKQALATLGGVDPKKTSTEDLIQAQSARIAALEHDNAAMAAVAAHRIAEQADIDLIKSQPTVDAMSALAARLAPAGDQQPKPDQPRTPRPDPSIGRGGRGDEKATGTVASGRDLFAERHGKTNT